MASIYDNYQIAQSKLARPYIGNDLSEIRELGNEMQRRYDTTVATMDNMEMIKRQVQTDPKSKAALDETLTGINKQLQDYAGRPDKENLVRPTSILARDFANDARVFMNNARAIQGYNEEVDKMDKVDRDTKELTKAVAYAEYQGLRRDPKTGQLVNKFNGSYTPPPSPDVPTLVNKIGEGIKADSNGSAVRSINGDYYVEQGGSWKAVPKERVRQITQNILATDPDFQSYLSYQQMMHTKKNYLTSRINSAEDIDPQNRGIITDYMTRNGVNAREAYANLQGAQRVKEIYNGIENAAIGKFAFREQDSSNKIMGKTEDAVKRDSEPLRFMIAAPTTMATGELAGMNSSDLQSKVGEGDKAIADQTNLLKRLISSGAAQSDVNSAMGQLRNLQDQKVAAQGVLDNTRNEAARQMGFQDYKDFQTKSVATGVDKMMADMKTDARGNVLDIAAQAYDAQGRPIPGQKITKDQLKTALVNNNIRTVNPSEDGIPGGSYYEIPGPNGGSIRVPQGNGDNTFSYMLYNAGPTGDLRSRFEKKTNELLREGKNLTSTSHQINIEKGDGTESLQRLYTADPNAFTVYDRAGNKIEKQSKLPTDINFASVNVVKNGNGSVSLQGYTEDPKTKEKEYYTIVPNASNNIGPRLGARILQDAKKMQPGTEKDDFLKAGFNLMGDDWDGKLREVEINRDVPITNAFGTPVANIRKERSEANPKQVVYRLYQADGKTRVVLPDPQTGMMTDVSTTDIQDAANKARTIIQNANQRASQ